MNLTRNNYQDALTILGLMGLSVFTALTLGIIRPIKAPYTYNPSMVLTDITLADFNGSTGLAQDAVPVLQEDPFTNEVVATLADPAGGWTWSVTGGVNLPQTIYGYALLNAGGTVLEGVSDPLTTPIPLTAQGQGFNAGRFGFRLLPAGYTSNDQL